MMKTMRMTRMMMMMMLPCWTLLARLSFKVCDLSPEAGCMTLLAAACMGACLGRLESACARHAASSLRHPVHCV